MNDINNKRQAGMQKFSGLSSFQAMLLSFILGVILAYLLIGFLTDKSVTNNSINNDEAEKKPLYWVAPMDPNYRKDGPGLSPMGMDLVPFYGDSGDATSDQGLIKISPTVINNLGVRTAEATFQSVNASFKSVGMVQYNEELLTHIHPRVEGWIEKLYLTSTGDPVEKGQPIYEMYSPELVNAQEEFLLAMSRNNQRLQQAAEARLLALQFSPQQITQLKQSKSTQQRVTFYAPHDGVVVDLKIREGFYVKPGDTLMSMGTLANIWVVADVLERQVNMLKANHSVVMTSDFLPNRKWQGEVKYIYPTLDPMTRTLKVRLEFDNEDQALKPNMFTQVTFNDSNETNKLVVPTEAVIRTGDSNRVVKAMGDGQFKSIPVRLGNHYSSQVEIIEGLEAGDEVVISAQFLLDSESSQSAGLERITAADSSQIDHSKLNHSEMNHSKMDHSKMDHSKMDHSKMDHSKMEHSKMDHSKMDHSKMEHPPTDTNDGQQEAK